MKKILITGANSFIGTSFENFLKERESEYIVETVGMKDGTWKNKSFCGYDVIFHVAGIAHSDVKKGSKEQQALYRKINTELAIETAKKAKCDGVKQFIFMSSAIVYGESSKIGKSKVIDKSTLPGPKNFYGDSKLQAEKGIQDLQDDNFNVVILRPPMIYGKNCKGNYLMLSQFAKKLAFFPSIKNQRSMLYVENLCEFIRLVIKNQDKGIFHPQNNEYGNTSLIVKAVATANGKKIRLIKGFGWALKILSLFCKLVNKAFGSFTYDKSLSEYKENYIVCSLEESIIRTEK